MNNSFYLLIIATLIGMTLNLLESSKRLSKTISGIIRLCCIIIIYLYIRILGKYEPNIYIDVIYGAIAIGFIIYIVYHVRKQRNSRNKDI